MTATDVLQPNKFFEILNQHFEEEAWCRGVLGLIQVPEVRMTSKAFQFQQIFAIETRCRFSCLVLCLRDDLNKAVLLN